MPADRFHLLLCCDQTQPLCCAKDKGLASWDFLKRRLRERGWADRGGIARTKANCLRICDRGPILVVYPDGVWYHSATPENLERILEEHLGHGRIVDELCFARGQLSGHPCLAEASVAATSTCQLTSPK